MMRPLSASMLALALAGCVNMAPAHERPSLASARPSEDAAATHASTQPFTISIAILLVRTASAPDLDGDGHDDDDDGHERPHDDDAPETVAAVASQRATGKRATNYVIPADVVGGP